VVHSQLPSGPVLTIYLTNLPAPVMQPSNGVWNATTRELQLTAEASAGAFFVFCGETIAVTFLTRTNHTYECQWSDDELHTFQTSAMRVIGTGAEVTLYDYPNHPTRAYRVAEREL